MSETKETIVKVTCKQPAGFYVRACRSFLEGVPAKEAKDGTLTEARPAVEEITVTALGNAISVQASVVGRLQALEVANITRVTTEYPKLENGKVTSQVAQMRVTLKVITEEPVDESGYHEKKLKVVKKEGGKKGAEIAGAADMGGIEYFTTTVETPEGDPRLVEIVMQEMNVKVDPTAEETKGGAGHVGKLLLSASDAQLALVAYVPKEKVGKIAAKDWLQHLFTAFGCGEFVGTPGAKKAVGVVKQDKEKGKFPIKLRDEGLNASIALLKSKGLFPDKDDSSDEMVFGDDDFPCG
jgi:hypothetical protein